jgi:beta-lactam-binding protein with PASTA domain
MNWFDLSSRRVATVHLGVIAVIAISGIIFFFNYYLPVTTKHGETITVPNVVGLNVSELDEFLSRRNLRFEVTEDSSYSPDYPPFTVLKQFPAENSKVKENRKIYISLNSSSPPMVKMPNLIEGSLKNAQMVLKTYDLILGKTDYKPDLIFNTVLEQRIDGRLVKSGQLVAKGSVIDVVLGDGFGNQALESPNLISLDEESARFAITGSALKIGDVQYESTGKAVRVERDAEGNEVFKKFQVAPGEVFKQLPEPGTAMRIKDIVHIWVYKPDSVSLSPSLLDIE